MEIEKDSIAPPTTERVAIFVGSAASIFEPTCLPLWGDFVRGVVNGLIYTALKKENSELTEKILKAKPYTILETIVRRLGVEYLNVMTSLDHQPNNEIHTYLADGLLEGRFPCLVTTNFDRCVEDLVERKGQVLCELHGQNLEDDIQALERQANLNQSMNIVVCVSPLSFTLLKRVPSLLGRKDYGFILKVHGDCRHPSTCIDTEAQRARGLPSSVMGVLSLILQRFTMMFIGWSGADLDENENYIPLRSERDLARIYWLLRPNETEPKAFEKIRKLLGDRFSIMRGNLIGKLPTKKPGELTLFEIKTREWARKHIGEKWSRTVLSDLARDAEAWNEFNLLLKSSDESLSTDLARSARLSVESSQTNFGFFSVPSSFFARRHATLVFRILTSLDFLMKGNLSMAWKFARDASTRAISSVLPSGDLRFSDSWVPFALCALILSHDTENKDSQNLAYYCYLDAISASIESGNYHAKKLLTSFHQLFKVPVEKPAIAQSDAKPDDEQDPFDIFTLNFDNAARVTTGVPDYILMRAELYRAALAGNRAAIPTQFLLDSRPFVTEVIFSDIDDSNQTEILELIRPILFDEVGVNKVDCTKSEHPIITTRLEGYVNNPNLIYEEIPMEMIERIDEYYVKHKTTMSFFDAKQVANAYKSRTLALLDDLSSIPSHFPGKRAAKDAQIVFPILAEFARATAPGETVLYRTLLYKFGDLFVKSTSEDDFWNGFYPNVKESLTSHYGSKEKLIEKRRIVTNKPHRFCEIVKDASDAAYTTNLPIHKKFSFAVDEKDLRPLKLVASALKTEPNSFIKMDEHPINVGSLDALQLANLPMIKLRELRGSVEAAKFRQACREAKVASDADFAKARNQCVATATVLYQLIKENTLKPGQRALPLKLQMKTCSGLIPDFVKLREAILLGVRPSLAPPPHLYLIFQFLTFRD